MTTTYYTRTRWDGGETTIDEIGFDTIEEAAQYVYDGNNVGSSWVYQVFALKTNGKDIVTGAHDATEQVRRIIISMWKANLGKWEFYPQLIASYVDENYIRQDNGDLVHIDDVDEVSVADDNRLTMGDVI